MQNRRRTRHRSKERNIVSKPPHIPEPLDSHTHALGICSRDRAKRILELVWKCGGEKSFLLQRALRRSSTTQQPNPRLLPQYRAIHFVSIMNYTHTTTQILSFPDCFACSQLFFKKSFSCNCKECRKTLQ